MEESRPSAIMLGLTVKILSRLPDHSILRPFKGKYRSVTALLINISSIPARFRRRNVSAVFQLGRPVNPHRLLFSLWITVSKFFGSRKLRDGEIFAKTNWKQPFFGDRGKNTSNLMQFFEARCSFSRLSDFRFLEWSIKAIKVRIKHKTMLINCLLRTFGLFQPNFNEVVCEKISKNWCFLAFSLRLRPGENLTRLSF